MRRRPIAPLPGALLGLTVAAELAAVPLSWGLEPAWDTLLLAAFAVTLAGAGALVASRHRENSPTSGRALNSPLTDTFAGVSTLADLVDGPPASRLTPPRGQLRVSVMASASSSTERSRAAGAGD
jgi:hypothetical protein